MDTERNDSASKGELVKFNLQQCRGCGRVYVSSNQAEKIGAQSGWFQDISSIRQHLESIPGYDPVIRVSQGKRGSKTCSNCR